MKFIIFIAIFFVIGSILTYSLSNYTKPFYDDPNNHIQELKKIPEVNKFFNVHENISVYTKEYEIIDKKTGEREENKFRIEFYSKSNNESHLLQVYYFAWMPFPITYRCVNVDENIVELYSNNIVNEIRSIC